MLSLPNMRQVMVERIATRDVAMRRNEDGLVHVGAPWQRSITLEASWNRTAGQINRSEKD